MHSTNDLEDGYMGGGIRIKNSIKVHGKDNHKKEILEFLNNRKELAEREKEIVNPDCLKDSLCMNLCTGGTYYDRGWKEEDRKKARERIKELSKDPEWNSKFRKAISESRKIKKSKGFSGIKHKDESKIMIGLSNSNSQKGEKNSQYGTRWITNGNENRKIKQFEPIPSGWNIGRTGNK